MSDTDYPLMAANEAKERLTDCTLVCPHCLGVSTFRADGGSELGPMPERMLELMRLRGSAPANEAGGRAALICGACNQPFGDTQAAFDHACIPPSKPCTEGGDHCFCTITTKGRGTVMAPGVYKVCCWCAEMQLDERQRVPGHGKYRTELVRE